MKKLIILLFITSSVIGQSNTVKFVSPTTRTCDYTLLDEFIDLYSEYEAECYNDSTLLKTMGGYERETKVEYDSLGRKVIDLQGVYSIPAISIYKEKWIHQEPTLKGFIEFLKRKRGEK